MNPLLTIVIPVYKIQEEYLRKCIESILDAACEDVKIILIDDGSPDDCGSVCDEYAGKNDCLTVIHQENRGVSAARNIGLQEAQTPWIMFADSDDWLETQSVIKICNLLKTEAVQADIVFFDYFDEFASESVLQKIKTEKGFLNSETLHACRIAPFYKFVQSGTENAYSLAVVWNKVYKKSFLEQNNVKFLCDVPLGEDRIFNADAMLKTDKIFYCPETIYHYRWRSDSVTNRYNPKITDHCLKELSGLKQVLDENKRLAEFERYFTCRVCTRVYSCMRLYFFHKDNPLSYAEKKKELKRFLSNDIFQTAFKKADKTLFSFQEKVFVFSIRKKTFFLSYFLVVLKNRITKSKLG